MLGWTRNDETRDGIRCRPFAPEADHGLPTGALYQRDGMPLDGIAPLLLTQHGGSSHKQGADVWSAAAEFAGALGWRVIALDGPVHGVRTEGGVPTDGPSTRGRFFQLWENEPAHVETHVGRWRALIDELVAAWPGAPLHWFGLSMGTAYGLPLLAVERRIQRAVLGMWGTSFVQSKRLADDARRVGCPVLFQQKWDDELFSREGQLAIFDALGTRDKRLYAYPGGHVAVAGEQMRDVVAFLSAQHPG